jgi:hypothetical protein
MFIMLVVAVDGACCGLLVGNAVLLEVQVDAGIASSIYR